MLEDHASDIVMPSLACNITITMSANHVTVSIVGM